MAKGTENAYWQWVKVFHKIFRTFGYMPYGINEGQKSSVSNYLNWSWAVMVNSLQIYILTKNMFLETLDFQVWDGYMDLVTIFFKLAGICQSLQFLNFWISLSKFNKFSRDYQQFEKQFTEVTGNCVGKPNCSFPKWKFTFLLKITTLAFIIDVCFILTKSNALYFCFVLLSCKSCFITIFWIFNCAFLTQIARETRSLLLNMLISHPGAKAVHSYRLLWFKLLHFVSQLTVCFTYIMTSHFITCVLSFLLTSYILTAGVITRNYHIHFGFFTVWLRNFVNFAAFREAWHLVKMEVGRETLIKLLSLKTQCLATDIQDEIEVLTHFMTTNTSIFDLAGYISIDRTFTLKIATQSISYMIVLLQFHVATEEFMSTSFTGR